MSEMHRHTKTEERDIQNRIKSDLGGTLSPFGPAGRCWIGMLVCIVAAAFFAYVWQLWYGLKVTAMRNFVSWGVYITNFVFFIGISHAGTLISAILRVTHAEWRRPITRMAEAITVFALMVGAPMVIIDMGRPDRIHHIFLYGRLQSPLLWDLLSISTYMCGSLLYLYVAMIPDVANLASATAVNPHSFKHRFYRFLAIGYRDTPEQKRYLEKAMATMAVIIIPVAISVHTVISWIFGMTLRPGWHSSIFGPYYTNCARTLSSAGCDCQTHAAGIQRHGTPWLDCGPRLNFRRALGNYRSFWPFL